MTEPDETLRRGYEAYRHREGPNSEQRAQMWEGIEALISAGQSGPRLVEPEHRSRGPSWVRGFAIGAALAAAVALLWAVADFGSVMLHAEGSSSGSQAIDQVITAGDGGRAVARRSKAGAQAKVVDVAPKKVPMSVAPLEVVPTERPSHGESVAAVPKKTKRSKTVAEPAASDAVPEPEVTTSVEEAAVLRRARSALASGDAGRALMLVREHARRFAKGALAPERGLLEVDVLCRLDRVDDARAAASRYAQQFPQSGWNARIARSCVR